MQKNVFLYGFGPFLQWTQNITQKIIESIPEQKGLYKQVLPVEFKEEVFIDPLEQYQPVVVIGMGQHAKTKKIYIEKKAINKKCNPKEKPQKIFSNSPDSFFLNLDFPENEKTAISHNAGMYVCNFSMYVVANYLQQRGGQSGFLHIPWDMELDHAVLYVNKVVEFVLEC